MNLISCKTSNEAAEKVLHELRKSHDSLQRPIQIFVPTGKSPKSIYAALAQDKPYWSTVLSPIQIDEFIDNRRLFYGQLNHELLSPLGLQSRGKFIDPTWTDLQMQDHVEKVLGAGVDIALLGLGPNGHVGFHEPGYPASFCGGRVVITDETRRSILDAKTNSVFTFGVGAFLQCRHVLLIVLGTEKKAVLEKIMNSPPTVELPATLLKTHHSLTLISDLI